MSTTEPTLEKQIIRQAPLIMTKIRQAADSAVGKPHPEKVFRKPVEDVLAEFAKSLDIQLDPRQEYMLLSGRADTIYNRLIIEFERPGYLSRKKKAASNAHALQQLRDYLTNIAKAERQKFLAGVALDGRYFIFARLKEGQWRVDPPEPVTPATTERFLRYLLSLQTELSLTPENLIRDFGEKSQVARKCVGRLYPALSDALEAKKPKRVEILFRQWAELFSEVCDFEAGTKKLKTEELAASYGIVTTQPDLFRLFYCVHTYYSTFIKLLAYQVASHYASPEHEADLGSLGLASSDNILGFLREVEKGGVFREKLRINNFLEADFFDWYLDLWNDELHRGIGGVIRRLGDYSLLTLDTDPETTRDILKVLYEHLVPNQLRHALGEYYTPDWLAERLLQQLMGGISSRDLKVRSVDPACGSGTFLVLRIRRMRQAALELGWSEEQTLRSCLNGVIGFDLNPLAVITARTNYLLALGDLLAHRDDESLDIPVYLADSIMTPSRGQELIDRDIFTFPTAVGPFSLPASRSARNIPIELVVC